MFTDWCYTTWCTFLFGILHERILLKKWFSQILVLLNIPFIPKFKYGVF